MGGNRVSRNKLAAGRIGNGNVNLPVLNGYGLVSALLAEVGDSDGGLAVLGVATHDELAVKGPLRGFLVYKYIRNMFVGVYIEENDTYWQGRGNQAQHQAGEGEGPRW